MTDRCTARPSVFVIGTRAQLIKVAPVIVACERIGQPTTLLMTGQHKETMLDLIGEFGIASPHINVTAIEERATVHSLIRWLPRAYSGVVRELTRIRKLDPAFDVIVHGDTLSTLVGAIAGRRCGGRVVHIESGLTSGHLWDPFPEEISRRLVFRMTGLAFCPNQAAAVNMARYGCEVVDSCGNTIVDAIKLVGVRPKADAGRYVVASLHRFQNLYDDARLETLISLLERIATILPIHFVLHPATRKRLASRNLMSRLESCDGIHLLPRLGYRDFLELAANAACVLTDGGSNQEELAVLGTPTVVMRARTERPDGLGANARMENEIEGGLFPWFASNGFEQLRRPREPDAELGPSMRIARRLAGRDG